MDLSQKHGIGDTPVADLEIVLGGIRHRLLLKLEGASRYGSMKDRVAWSLLEAAMARPDFADFAGVVDASSGNYGRALAELGRALGVRVTVVSSPNIAPANAAAIEAAGATLIKEVAQPGESSHEARLRRSRACAAAENLLFLDQYHNPQNPQAHYDWTAPEVFSGPAFDACVLCASSGGSVRGFARYMAENHVAAELIVADAAKSNVVDEAPPADARSLTIPGFGSQRRSAFVPLEQPYRMYRFCDAQVVAAFQAMHAIGRWSIGLSSSAAVLAAIDWLAERDRSSTALCLCADGFDRYEEHAAAVRAPDAQVAAYRAEIAPVLARLSERRCDRAMRA